MKPDPFSKDAQDFLRLLAQHDVRYVLIGGTAVIFHGYARLTGDMVVLYDHRHENAERLWAALFEFWQGSVPAVASAVQLEGPNLVVQFGRPPNRIDLVASLPAVVFDDAWRGRVHERIRSAGASPGHRLHPSPGAWVSGARTWPSTSGRS